MQTNHKKAVLFLFFGLILLVPFVFSQERIIVEYRNIVDNPEIRVDIYDINAIPIPQAKEDFTASASQASLSACVLSNEQNSIRIDNIGETSSDYQITLEGSASQYITSVPSSFSLMPGKSAIITNYIHFPKDAMGKYYLKVKIATSTGIQKELVQEINSKLCDNNYLLVYNFNQSACPCLQMAYDFTVKNLGSYVETYKFSLDKFAEYSNISANPLVLGPGEEENIRLYLNLDCSIYGDYIVNFYSTAQSSGIKTKVPLLLNINSCYDYNIVSGKLLDNNDNKFNASFASQKSSYAVCAGDHNSIQIMVENTGYIGNNFFYSADGPVWGSMYGDVLRLNGYDKGYTYLDLSPDKDTKGESKFVINMNSQRGNEKMQKEISVNVSDCYGLLVDVPKEELVCNCEQSSITTKVTNMGVYEEEVLLELESPDFISLSANSIRIKPGQTSDVTLNIGPSCTAKGWSGAKIKVYLANENAYSEDNVGIKIVPIEKCYKADIISDKSIRINYSRTTLPFAIKSNGEKKAEYNLAIEGADWIKLNADPFSLEPKEQYAFTITTQPGNISQGNYYALLNISADNIIYQKKIRFELRESKSILSKMADWIKYYRYWIATGIVILILALLLSFYLKEKSRVWKIRRMIKKATQEKKEQKNVNNKAEKKNGKKEVRKKFPRIWFILLIILSAIVYLFISFKAAFILVLAYIFAFIIDYIWYILIGFVLLWITIFILNNIEKK